MSKLIKIHVAVHLVERNRNPNGAHILSLNRVSIHESSDIISLATQIQRADEAVKDVACGKLALILEQVCFTPQLFLK